MTNLPNNLVVVDLETSGTNPFRHEVLAVGLVPLTEKIPPYLLYVRGEAKGTFFFCKGLCRLAHRLTKCDLKPPATRRSAQRE